MRDIPPSLWAAAPKDVRWWMGALPVDPDPIDWYDVDGTLCPGHGYVVDDSGDMDHCDGSCLSRRTAAKGTPSP